MARLRIHIDWFQAPDDTLVTVSGLDATPLAAISRRARYALMNCGEIPVVVVGRRRYLRVGAIREFLRTREQRLGGAAK